MEDYTDDTRILFGKHKFTKLKNLAPEYLISLFFNNEHKDLKLKQYVRKNAERILTHFPLPVDKATIEDVKKCGKLLYCSENVAKQHLAAIRRIDQSHKAPIRTYYCELCNAWHLTSKELYGLNLTNKEALA